MLFSLSSTPIYFNLDDAWTEVMNVIKIINQYWFTITTYNISKGADGHLVAEPVVHSIHFITFIEAYLVFTTLNDVVFWWNKSVNGELDDD